MNKNNPYFVFVNKPVGMSSADVVRYFKLNLPKPVNKIGHIGTLDPFAEGLLIIGVNGAQKANDFIHEGGAKTYLAHGLFGVSTTTGDHTGEVVHVNNLEEVSSDLKKISEKDLTNFFRREFLGEYFQKPHKVSAVKVNGKRLYTYEREGIEVEVKASRREIFEIEVLEFNFPQIIFRAKVSSGTYIRVLFEEMAQKFNLAGHLTKLVRETVGEVQLESALSKNDWPIKGEHFNPAHYISITKVLNYPRLHFGAHHCKLFSNGVRLRTEQVFGAENLSQAQEGQRFWACDENGELIGLFEVKNRQTCHLFNFSK